MFSIELPSNASHRSIKLVENKKSISDFSNELRYFLHSTISRTFRGAISYRFWPMLTSRKYLRYYIS